MNGNLGKLLMILVKKIYYTVKNSFLHALFVLLKQGYMYVDHKGKLWSFFILTYLAGNLLN
jgi:hypothetical protein